ncbi:hypothetical protein ACFX1Q_034703 [Malus domestica]
MSITNSNNDTNNHASDRDLGLWFLEQSQLRSAWGRTNMDEDEGAPTELNTINSSAGPIWSTVATGFSFDLV